MKVCVQHWCAQRGAEPMVILYLRCWEHHHKRWFMFTFGDRAAASAPRKYQDNRIIAVYNFRALSEKVSTFSYTRERERGEAGNPTVFIQHPYCKAMTYQLFLGRFLTTQFKLRNLCRSQSFSEILHIRLTECPPPKLLFPISAALSTHYQYSVRCGEILITYTTSYNLD